MNKIRVYFPLGSEYYMESPWVEINGRRAFDPVNGQPSMKLADVVKQAEQKGTAVIDCEMSLSSCYTPGKATATSASKMSYGIGYEEEKSQIALTIALADGGLPGCARVGLADAALNLGIFGGVANAENLTVGGTYGTETLNVIGKLAMFGFLKFSKVHVEATDDVFFADDPTLDSFSHTKECYSRNVHYPLATAEDDNTNIRTLDEQYLADKAIDLTMNGKNFLKLPIPAGSGANITLYTHFVPKH